VRLRDGGSCKWLVDSRSLIARMCIIVAAKGQGRKGGWREGGRDTLPFAARATRESFRFQIHTDRAGERSRDAQFGGEGEGGKKSRNAGRVGGRL